MVKPDQLTIIQGAAGSGKTTLLRQHVAAALDRGWWSLVQDPNKQFADILPHYPNVDAWSQALQAAADGAETGSRISMGASIGEVDEEPFTAAVLELAAHTSRPVHVAYDEAVLMVGSTPNHVSATFRNMIGRRRHLGICPEILCQDLGMLHALWQRTCTEAYVFRCRDEKRVKTISERFGVPFRELWEKVRSLGDYQWLRIEQG